MAREMASASEGAAAVNGMVGSLGIGIYGTFVIFVITVTTGISAIEIWAVVACRNLGRRAAATRPLLAT